MYEKTVICLANSRKPPSGRCIAGKEIEGNNKGAWIRPVSSRSGHEVSEEEREYENGEKAQLLDVITIPLKKHSPLDHQTENHILDKGYYWVKQCTYGWKEVNHLVDAYDEEFWKNAESTQNGLNDKVPEDIANAMSSSLKLVALEEIELRVQKEDGYAGNPGRRRVRTYFKYHDSSYLLSVTDPEIIEKYLAMKDGKYQLKNVVMCVSLSEVWEKTPFAFRLAASVITQDRCGS